MIILLMIVLFAMSFRKLQDNTYNQTQLVKDMESKVVREILITPNSEAPTGYATIVFDGSTKKLYATDVRQLEQLIRDNGYEPTIQDIEREGWFSTYVLPLLLVLVVCFFFFMMMNAQHNAMEAFDGNAARQAASASPMAQRRQADKVTVVRSEPKVGRNDPCPCGSGRKYKQCCGR